MHLVDDIDGADRSPSLARLPRASDHHVAVTFERWPVKRRGHELTSAPMGRPFRREQPVAEETSGALVRRCLGEAFVVRDEDLFDVRRMV